MGNKIVTEADRKFTPQPKPLPGQSLPTAGRGQRVSLERGVATRSKKNPARQPGARGRHAQQQEPRQALEEGRLSLR